MRPGVDPSSAPNKPPLAAARLRPRDEARAGRSSAIARFRCATAPTIYVDLYRPAARPASRPADPARPGAPTASMACPTSVLAALGRRPRVAVAASRRSRRRTRRSGARAAMRSRSPIRAAPGCRRATSTTTASGRRRLLRLHRVAGRAALDERQGRDDRRLLSRGDPVSVAPLKPPHLAALNPWEGFSDWYREFAYHGGIPRDGLPARAHRTTSASRSTAPRTPGPTSRRTR